MDCNKRLITVSLVTFKTSADDIQALLNSLEHVKTPFILFVIDNSPSDLLKSHFEQLDYVEYFHNPNNPGFGASHNIAINLSIERDSDFHFVINPDVYFRDDVITPMINFMDKNKEVGMLMPQILNTDGSVQNLPKLLPSPYSILMRKLKFPKFLYLKFINRYELRFVPNNVVYNAPILSGCFTMFRTNVLNEIGGYDDKFFMYFEDWDLSRRVHMKYKTVYFPEVGIFHGYESGANKSGVLFRIFVNSAIYYFNKWGWFIDPRRQNINKRALEQFEN